jgi:hypothetical protein
MTNFLYNVHIKVTVNNKEYNSVVETECMFDAGT